MDSFCRRQTCSVNDNTDDAGHAEPSVRMPFKMAAAHKAAGWVEGLSKTY
ncbi:MAG: hypothetical protein Q4F85_12165 [Prevotella sp.]|nr:hypothetical protein [Prevotella sp.]